MKRKFAFVSSIILLFSLIFTMSGCDLINGIINPPIIPTITISKTETRLTEGGSETLTATMDEGALGTIAWSSSDTTKVTVSNGTITAVAEGNATITASWSEDSSIKATCAVTVNPLPVDNGMISGTNIPAFAGQPFVTLNDNVPVFSAEEKTTVGYEKYSDLDDLGRCGVAVASLGRETMPAPDEERGSISNVKPSGWIQKKYDSSIVSGGYLYNRSHMIGWQLSAENDNKKNLITGTRYFNAPGMLDFENMVADYIKETNNHVAYRVTPVYVGNNLVCHGVQIEAYSVEDNGEGICYNVFIYNVQPGIKINYADGSSELETATTGMSVVINVDMMIEERNIA